jgi:uncharacterized protein (DUF2237 family)
MHQGNGNGNGTKPKAKNVLGGELEVCCTAPMTGFYRNGKCDTGVDDRGVHTVCVEVTADFSVQQEPRQRFKQPRARLSRFRGWGQMVSVRVALERGF